MCFFDSAWMGWERNLSVSFFLCFFVSIWVLMNRNQYFKIARGWQNDDCTSYTLLFSFSYIYIYIIDNMLSDDECAIYSRAVTAQLTSFRRKKIDYYYYYFSNLFCNSLWHRFCLHQLNNTNEESLLYFLKFRIASRRLALPNRRRSIL